MSENDHDSIGSESCGDSEHGDCRDSRVTGISCRALKNAVATLNRLDDFYCESIGTGFFSEVFRVTHKVTGQVMVLKMNQLRSNRPNMLKEVQLMNQLSHPNILGFMGVCVHEGQLHALTEYINGGRLEKIIQDRSIPLPYSVRMKLTLDIARGMEYLHSRDIFHRDLTSKNILVKKNDETGEMTAVVGDFGFAAKIPRCGYRLTTVGSFYWMSPECLKGEWYDESSDVFSFGIIGCELIARIEADPDVMPRTENFGLDYIAFTKMCTGPPPPPPMFLRLVFISCNYDPKNRPTFSEIVIQLERLLAEEETKEPIEEHLNHPKLGHRRSYSDDGIRIIGETMAQQDVHYKPTPVNPFVNIPVFKAKELGVGGGEPEGEVIAEPVVKPSQILQSLKARPDHNLFQTIFLRHPHYKSHSKEEVCSGIASMPPSLPSSPTFMRRVSAPRPQQTPGFRPLRSCSSGSNLACLEEGNNCMGRRGSCESGFFSCLGDECLYPVGASSSVTLSSSSAASSLLLDTHPDPHHVRHGHIHRHRPQYRTSSVYTDSSDDISNLDPDSQCGGQAAQITKMVEYFERKQVCGSSCLEAIAPRKATTPAPRKTQQAPLHNGRLLVCEGAVSSKLQLFDRK